MTKYRWRNYQGKNPGFIEAERVELNLIPCFEGGFVSRNNPFDAVVMRRPKWWSLSRVPMVKTRAGWEEVLPYEWVARYEDGSLATFSEWLFSKTFEPA